MNKTIVVLLALTIVALAGNSRGLRFQLGNSIATVISSGSRYNGAVAVQCDGGNGGYSYSFSGLPNGWTSQGNVITIPNIVNVVGEYVIRARVTDASGAVLEGDIRLVVNGVNVVIQSANANTDNNIQVNFAPSGSNGAFGGNAPSGAFPSGSFPSGSFPSGGSPSGSFPSGGSPSGSFPSGGSPSGPSVAPLYDNYPGLPAGSGPNPPADGRYPTPPSPSGPPSLPNIVPSLISSAQAPFNPNRDTRPITVDEVKRNAAFNRQLNANKGVANLISIIQQLTANVNAAKNDIGTLDNLFKTAESNYNECNGRIYDLSNTRTKIQNAIKDRQDKITEANRKINDLAPSLRDLTNTRDNLVSRRNEIENSRSPNSARLNDLINQNKDCTSNRNKLQRQLDNVISQIDGINNSIKKTQDDAASAPGAIDLINQQIPIIDSKIDDLRRQLENAQKDKTRLLSDRDNYQRIIADSARKISDLQSQLPALRDRLPDLQSQVADSTANCDGIQKQIDDFRNQLAQKEADYKILAEQIATQEGLIKNKNDESKKFSDSVSNLPGEIAALQQELARVEDTIRRQYYICNDAADAVKKAKQNVDAINNKYQTESSWLRDANNNLERARAEKELADTAVQQIISSSTAALPFSIVPNGNGQTPAGTPAGNNPSGSPLGSVPDRNQIVPGSPVVVGDLNTYLSQAYGAGVDPSRPSTVTTLFPLSSLTLQALTGQSNSGVFMPDGTFVTGGSTGVQGPSINAPYGGGKLANFNCNGQNGLTQGEGRVVSVQPGRVIVAAQNGNQYNLNVGGCSMINAIQKNFSIVPQTRVWFKGAQNGQGSINLQQMTCV